MEQSGIYAIRDMAAAEQVNATLTELSEFITPSIALPNDYKLINLEQFSHAPARFRCTFNTTLIEEFIAYVNNNGTSASGIFVNPIDATAHAIIDLGDHDKPKWGDHLACLNLKKLPEFAKLLDTQDKKLTQQELIDFAEDWQGNIQFIDEKNIDLDFRASINAIRRLTVNATQNNESTVGNFNASQSSMDAIEVKSAGATPPYGFIFLCQPYESFGTVTLICQLRALTDGKTVTLKYRITALEKTINNLGQEFKELLKKAITVDEVSFYTGTMKYQK
jgi:uncharacterized protein YfdQ (DUF2303 family)